MTRKLIRCLACLLIHAVIVTTGAVTAWAAHRTPPESERTATLGMIAYSDPKAQFKTIAPLADYLGKAARLQVKLKLYSDYCSLLNDIDHESLDLAIVSPLVYAFCMDDPDLTYLSTALEKGKPFYHCAILARKDSKILTVGDLVGKKVAFVDTYSASGYVYPAAFFLQEGLVKDGRPLYTPVFCGSHGKSLRALLEGRVDAAPTFDNFFTFTGNSLDGQGNLSLDSFRILKLLPEQIPADAVVCRTALGTQTIRLLGEALRGYETERSKRDSPLGSVFYTGFKPGQHAAYGAVRAYLEKLPGQNKPGGETDRVPEAQ